MKVLILGASGIVGQTMRLSTPEGIEPVWVRREADPITLGCDLNSPAALQSLLARHRPDVVINLAGECSVDTVERDPDKYAYLNVHVPARLALWASRYGMRFIHVSSQGVWDGEHAPYAAGPSGEEPVNAYGRQKKAAEEAVLRILGDRASVLRLTLVLGTRPLPHVGRQNPLEAMLAGQSPQAADRCFSPLMALDAAELIWGEAMEPSGQTIRQLGQPINVSRYEIARMVGCGEVQACAHADFPGIAPRPRDTSYEGSSFLRPVGIPPVLDDRAVEIALFFGQRYETALARLRTGFGPLHGEVTEDFNRSGASKAETALLDWYRQTEAYIWELAAYHEHPGFNYSGMCRGIAERLKAAGVKRVLCLGDGIGDLTLALDQLGFDVTYHDLARSRTAEYAAFRFWRQTGRRIVASLSETFEPSFAPESYDAVVSLDFLEHVVNVPDWAGAIQATLRPGGLFCAQNAFALGSGESGSMPMHLAVNDRFEKDWDPLLATLGFVQESSNWYRKPA